MSQEKKKRFRLLFKIAFTIGIFILIFNKMNIKMSEMTSVIHNYKFLWVCLFLSLILNPLIVGNRWRSFLSMINVKESTWNLIRITLISTFVGVAIPGVQGYDLMRIYNIEKLHPEARGTVGSTVLVERIMGLICLLFVAILSWSYIGVSDLFLPIFLFALLMAFISFFIMNKRCYQFIQSLLKKKMAESKVLTYISKVYEGIHTFPFNKSLLLSMILILALQISNIAITAFLFDACGYHVSFINHLCLIPIINVLTMIPLTIGGLGIREGGFALLYSQFAIPDNVIIAVSLMNYLIIMLVPAIIGGLFYLNHIIKNDNVVK